MPQTKALTNEEMLKNTTTERTIDRQVLNRECAKYLYNINGFRMVDCEAVYGWRIAEGHKVNMVFVCDVDKLVRHILKELADIDIVN